MIVTYLDWLALLDFDIMLHCVSQVDCLFIVQAPVYSLQGLLLLCIVNSVSKNMQVKN